MKKITVKVFLGLLMLSSFVSNAQFTEGFESGATIPATWTVLNGGDTGTWITSTLTPHGGTREAAIVYDDLVAHDDYLITPAITVTSGVSDRFSFWLRSRDPLYPETIDIVLSSTTPTASAFTTALELDVAPASGASFVKYSYDLTPYIGQTVYIGFHSTTLNQFVMDLDDVVNDALPFCSEPNAAASNVTETSATLTWAAVPGSLNYEYVFDNNAADPVGAGTATTALTYNASPLTAATTYYFHIRNNCDSAGFSAWTTVSVTTPAPFNGCLTASNGLYPATTYTPATCNGIVSNTVTAAGWAGEYSNVNVTSGQTYTFASSVSTDVITISTDDGATAAAYGVTPLVWVAPGDGVVRFYTHTDVDCGEENVSRTRSIICGIPACTIQTVTFAKVSHCPAATFDVTANITNMGSATSITVTDNQGSAPQTVTAAGTVTFGPYANGVSVILTATNDASASCVVASTAQTQGGCPPDNDNFAGALPVACGSSYTGLTTYATLDEANPTAQFGVDLDAPNVWYTYTGTGTPETVTLSLCTSTYDSSVAVFTGTSGALTMIAGNDDDASCGTGFGTRSKVSFTSDGTTTYHIVIEGYNAGSVGTYNMDVTCAAVTPPAVANQACGTALAVNVDGTDITSDNSYGDNSPTQPSCDTFGSIQDVWFSFVAPTSGTVDVVVSNGFMTSANFNVYSGACGSLTAVTGACNADITTSATESLTALVSGSTYYVQVWSSAAEQGTFSLRLTDPNLGTTNFQNSSLRVYPNPVKNVLNLSYDKNISSVAIFNLVGQEVMTKTIGANQSQIDMSHLANGTYMVKITADNQVKTIKVIKE